MRSGLKITGVALAAYLCAGVAGAAFFEPMFKFTTVVGDVRVFRPGAAEAVPAMEQHAYPYGSRIVVSKWDGRAKSPRPSANITLSSDHWFLLSDGADLSILNAEADPANNKVFDIRSGKIRTSITVSTVKTGSEATDAKVEAGIGALAFRVPNGITATRLTERNLISVERDAEGAAVTQFTTENGTMAAKGPQFEITQMKRQAQVEFYGGKDYTRITSLAGDFTGKIDKGVDSKGDLAVEEVQFKTRSVAKIWRNYSEIGGRMAVSVMVLPPDGKAVKSYNYLEGSAASQSSSMEAGIPEPEAAAAPADAPAAFDGGAAAPAFGAEAATPAEGQDGGDFGGINFDW